MEGLTLISIATNGEIYTGGPVSCTMPTQKIGDSSYASSCLTRTNASKHSVFSVQIGGASLEALALDKAGNAYVAGLAVPGGSGFATTPGAYKSSLPGDPYGANPFICKLSGDDGHPLFCTYGDIFFLNVPFPPLVVDSAGAPYIAGNCVSASADVCVEKLNPAGTALEYLTHTDLRTVTYVFPYAALDTQGNLFLAQPNGVVKLNPSGVVTGRNALENSQLIGLAVDPAGEPQILATVQPGEDSANFLVRRYKADLSAVLFDAPLFLPGNVSGMAVDATGITDLWGKTSDVNLPPVHPTAVCVPASNAFLTRLDNYGSTLQSTFLNGPPTLFSGAGMFFNSSGAYLLAIDTGLEILSLGPASSEVALSCIGSGASFKNAPLAPNQIVSLFGYGIGPSAPQLGQPDSNGLYPFQLGRTQISFDGVAAPLLYVSEDQVNLVTPRSLSGKTATHLCAVLNDATTNCLDVPVGPAAPDIFLSAGNRAAALNEDGTVNSAQNVAPTGSIVSLFLTGLGTTTPATPDGGITPYPPPAQDLQIKVVFTFQTQCFLYGGSESVVADPLYAGPALLEIEGVNQINVVVPSPPPPVDASCAPVIVKGGLSVAVEVLLPGGAAPISSPAVGIWTN